VLKMVQGKTEDKPIVDKEGFKNEKNKECFK